ncbi:MAG: helix-turn-helix transcriptional regulator [Erysipelotrichaceae bacterium]
MNNKKIADKLKEIRGKYSRNYMASFLGVSVSAIQMYENGERIPRDETKLKYAEFAKESVDSIFFT